MKVFVGTLIHSKSPANIEVLENSVIGYREETGEIVFVERDANEDLLIKLKETYSSTEDQWDVVTLSSGQFLMPGLVDTHIHAPQYRFTGLGYERQLLEWLETYTFPTEGKFRDVHFAREVYPKVVKRTLSHGTTTASYFATIHLESTKELCRIIADQGQRALVGKVNMDNKKTCPEFYVETTEDSVKDTLEFIEFVQQMKNPLIQPVITPRFAISCTEVLLKCLGEIAAEKNLPIQTHLCEQEDEIDFTMALFPDGFKHYTDVYDKAGLITNKSYFAHCVYLKEDELRVLKERNAGISHCPNSNLNIQSGLMESRKILGSGIKIGLGTDVAGGYHPSVFDALRTAVSTSKATGFGKGKEHTAISHHEAFYMATLGGAEVLSLGDKIGNFEVGKQFDALLVDTAAPHQYPVFDVFEGDTFEDVFSKFLYLGDDRNIVKVFVCGKEVINKC